MKTTDHFRRGSKVQNFKDQFEANWIFTLKKHFFVRYNKCVQRYRVQFEGPISTKVRLTCERIRLSFVLFSSYLFIFFTFFSLFLAFSLFFCVFYYKNTMDSHMHKILVVLVFTMAIHRIIAQMVSLQRVAITQHWSMMNVLLFLLQSLWTCRQEFGTYGSMKK